MSEMVDQKKIELKEKLYYQESQVQMFKICYFKNTEDISELGKIETEGANIGLFNVLKGKGFTRARYRILLARGIQCMNQVEGVTLVYIICSWY